MFYCSTIFVPLFHHQMFHRSTITCSTFPPATVLMFHHLCSTVSPPLLRCSTIRCSTVPPSDVPPSLFHYSNFISSTVPPSDVPLFYHQMFHCSTIRFSTVPHRLFHCSTIRCFTVPPSLFHCTTIICSIVPPSDVPLFHYRMLNCSSRSSNVPPSVFHCFTTSVTLFHHLCSTVL